MMTWSMLLLVKSTNEKFYTNLLVHLFLHKLQIGALHMAERGKTIAEQ